MRRANQTLLGAGWMVFVVGMAIAVEAPSPPAAVATSEQAWWKPYGPNQTEREYLFAFTEQPTVKRAGPDRYEIAFAVQGYCDVTVAIVDPDPAKERVKGRGTVVRHLASGVLGANAPAPFQRDSLRQTLVWNGKDDLDDYHRQPERLAARVSLGLNPLFDKLLGDSDPRNIPGMVLGIAIDEEGAYVWIRGQGGFGHITVRKFDRNGAYLHTLTPPPSHLPESKLAGRSFVEWEPGKRSHHGPYIQEDLGYAGQALPGIGGKGLVYFQPAIAGKRIFFCNAGPGYRSGNAPSQCYYIYTDGATDVRGMRGRLFMPGQGMGHEYPHMAASPDGEWLYVSSVVGQWTRGHAPVIMRMAVAGEGTAEPFIGRRAFAHGRWQFESGSDNASLNNPAGIATDARGRIYVCDSHNNRIQIFAPAGQYLKTIPVDRPQLVAVHQKTGAIYAQHSKVVAGRSLPCLTKFSSFDDPAEAGHVTGIQTAVMAVDSWSPKTRIWIGGGRNRMSATTTGSYFDRDGPGVTVWQEEDGKFVKIVDFDEEVRRGAGDDYVGRWEGAVFDKVVCDPTREQLWWCWEKSQSSRVAFDLVSGRPLGQFSLYGPTDDIAFCKRGYLHAHFNPGFFTPGAGRLDPDGRQPHEKQDGRWRMPAGRVFTLREVPYDYGVATALANKHNWAGILPTRCQPGAKYFQDGMGVNMRGDIAVQSNIYYIPKMEEDGWQLANAGRAMRDRLGQGSGPSSYQDFLRSVQEMEKRGEQVYYIRRQPGVPLAGGTIWTFESTGELRQESAVIASKLVIGSLIDEEGFLYFANDAARLIGGKAFLQGRGGNLGVDAPLSPYNRTPVTYTYMKSRPRNVRWLLRNAVVPLDPPPARPRDLVKFGPFGPPQAGGGEMWVEGAEWMFAGYAPSVPAGCTCPGTRPHLDWFKRSYIPEGYRYSIAMLDTNGNLIGHFGRYGNYDDALAMQSGSPDIALTRPRFVSGTDNYLAFDDWGERLVVLKLDYHAEQSAVIAALK